MWGAERGTSVVQQDAACEVLSEGMCAKPK